MNKFVKKLSLALAFTLMLALSACTGSATININTSDTESNSSYYEEILSDISSVITPEDSEISNVSSNKPSYNVTSKQNGGSIGNSTSSVTTRPNTQVSVQIGSIPAYSGSPYVAINNNQPKFSAAELTASGYEKYAELDSLGRVGVAIASLGKDTMPAPNEERESISSIKPTGWVQAEYSAISGRYLYNRSHLIGWQLSAENANKQNLLTGTNYLNIKGMLPFENMVADYINETGNHVAYRVTPHFLGNNLLCSGVQIEAYSVEDDGDGICFNVYCYNVQPNIEIDYSTGKSKSLVAESSSSKVVSSVNGVITYILNTNSKKFHYSDCNSAARIAEKNRAQSTKARDALIAEGYSPCLNCDP